MPRYSSSTPANETSTMLLDEAEEDLPFFTTPAVQLPSLLEWWRSVVSPSASVSGSAQTGEKRPMLDVGLPAQPVSAMQSVPSYAASQPIPVTQSLSSYPVTQSLSSYPTMQHFPTTQPLSSYSAMQPLPSSYATTQPILPDNIDANPSNPPFSPIRITGSQYQPPNPRYDPNASFEEKLNNPYYREFGKPSYPRDGYLNTYDTAAIRRRF